MGNGQSARQRVVNNGQRVQVKKEGLLQVLEKLRLFVLDHLSGHRTSGPGMGDSL